MVGRTFDASEQAWPIGLDAGAPVTPGYAPPFAFSGTVIRAVYDVSGERVEDHEAEIRIALARQ